jgi:hypothetical protein
MRHLTEERRHGEMRGASFTAADLQPLRRAGVIAELVRPSLAAPPLRARGFPR